MVNAIRSLLPVLVAAALALSTPDVRAQATLSGVTLDPVPEEVLQEILEAANLRSARVTSYQRTARKQAEIMYGICRARRGVAKARRTYSTAAERIIDVFVANRKKRRADVIALMTAETKRVLTDLGPGRTTLMHVDSHNYTFDVAPSSIRNRRRFAAAIKAHPDVVRVLEPGIGSERAYHIEVPRTLGPVRGPWVGSCAGDGATLAIDLTLDKAKRGYRGTLAINADVSTWSAQLDRRNKTVVLTAGEHTVGGTFTDDYKALTLTLGPLACTLAQPPSAKPER